MPKDKSYYNYESDESESNESESEEVNEVKEESVVEIDHTIYANKVVESDGKPSDLDESEFIYHPEDGSISYRVDENGCQKGYEWDKKLGRCIPIQK
jgi:hypothetical protein